MARAGIGVLLALLALEGSVRLIPGLYYPGAIRTPSGVESATRREQRRNPGEARTVPEPDGLERPRWYGVPRRAYRHYGMEYSTEVTHNALGFRDDQHPSRAEGVRRVIVLGDSFVEAREVPFEDTFHQQFESRLNAAHPGSVEVVNLGMAGLGTVDELLVLREFGPRFIKEGDVVVLVLYVGNDVLDNSLRLNSIKRREATADRPGFVLDEDGMLHYVPRYASTAETLSRDEQATLATPAPQSDENSPQPAVGRSSLRVLAWLGDHSHLAGVAYDKLGRSPLAGSLLAGLGVEAGPPAEAPFEYGVFAAEPDDAWQDGLAMTVRLIEEVQLEVARQGADFLLVIAPTRFQVYEDVWRDELAAYPALKAGKWSLDGPNGVLVQSGEEAGVPTLDLLPVLRACVPERPYLYERYGIHWSVEGHRLVGEVLAARLGPQVTDGEGFASPVCAG